MSLCQIKRSTKDRVSFCHQVHLHSQKSVTNICHFVPIQLPIWPPQGLFDWDSYLMLFNTQIYPDFIPISEISQKKQLNQNVQVIRESITLIVVIMYYQLILQLTI